MAEQVQALVVKPENFDLDPFSGNYMVEDYRLLASLPPICMLWLVCVCVCVRAQILQTYFPCILIEFQTF